MKYRKSSMPAVVAAALTTSVVALSFSAVSVHAQEASTTANKAEQGLGEILVTANRRLEKARNVPVTISAFSSQELTAKGIDTVADLGAITPGIQFNTVVGYATPFVRGVGSTSTGPGFENPIAVYIDGVYLASQGAALLSLNNIEGIEVDKGPQGTLFGRNATGGAIQVRTLKPSFSTSGKASISYGNYEDVAANGYVTGPLSENIAADLAVTYHNQGKGYGRNLTTGVDFEKAKEFVVRSKLLFQPSDRTEIILAGDYAKTEGRPALLPAPGAIPLGNRAPAANPRDGYGLWDPSSEVKQWGVSLNIRQDLGGVDLISISSFRRGDFHAVFDNTFTDDPAATFEIDTLEPHKQLTQELQLQSTGSGPFSWMVGGFYFWERASMGQPTVFRGGALGLTNLIQKPDSTINSPAVFGQGTYEITPGTKLTAGLRYTSEKKELGFYEAAIAPFLPGGQLTSQTYQSKTFKKVTWRLAITQDISDNATLFASYNRGFKSGGFNPSAKNSYEPEVLDAYEAGIKAETYGGRLRFNLAGFYYDYTNMQVTSFPKGALLVTNGGKSEIYGVDFDFKAAVTSEFTLSGGFELLHAKFTKFDDAPVTAPLPTGGNAQTGAVFSAAGQILPKAPKATFNIGANYEKKVNAGIFSADVLWSYNDGWFADAENRLAQPKYTLLNASMGFELENGLGIKVWGQNLTNELYATSLAVQTLSDHVQWAAPRTYGATVSFKY